ncbi:hypothetical protein HUU05_00960 [candidate division KSB1 bacterium]|nr:hypothetical protein [candidate division KSB1 bacterium]
MSQTITGQAELPCVIAKKFFYVGSLLHQRFIFACLPGLYLFKLADFKAMAFRHLADIFKRPACNA